MDGTAMGQGKTFLVKLICSALITVITAAVFGWLPTLVLLTAITIHELGHYGCLRLFGVRSHIFVSPLCGAVLPIDPTESLLDRLPFQLWHDKDTMDAPLTPLAQALVLLAGCTISLIVAAVLMRIIPRLTDAPHAIRYGIDLLVFIMLFMNIVNLCIPLPILDGGKVLLLIFATNHHPRLQTATLIGLCAALPVLWKLSPVFGSFMGIASLWALSTVTRTTARDAWLLTPVTRLLIAGAWLLVVVASWRLFLQDVPLVDMLDMLR